MPAESETLLLRKSVLITGASSGFGLAACEIFLQRGWKVHAAVRAGMERKQLFQQLWSHYPASLEILALDLSDRASINDLVEGFRAKRLDVLINNAGYGFFGAAEDMNEESLRRQMEVNFFGTFLLTQGLLPKLRSLSGTVITVSSIVGRHSLPLTSAYCASKFAVEGWMESMAMELQPFGVKCYLVEPGTFPTQFGAGIDWAVPKANSPYKNVSIGYENLRKKVYEGAKNRSVLSVAEKMWQLAEQRPRGLRHPIGPDARATLIAARLISPNLFHSVATWVLNRLQRRDMPA